MKCVDCFYYWKDKLNDINTCHCPDDMIAPCDEEEEDDEYE